MSDVLIKAEGVSKKFCKNLKRSMLYGVQDITKSMVGITPKADKLREKEFWAVDDISFELKRGECLGLIGPNGSGKSTLLKILNGIIEPDKGRIQINGKVGALIEVGAGFHPMLTGRENIYINGSILGFSKKEMDRKFDAIVDFAELDEFIDTPVKHYSSGMYVRLGFAIAAQMEPDVLLIDEVLAVGDVGFRAKCFNVIAKLCKNSAVILVSHSMPQVARICSNLSVIKKGETIFQGRDVSKGISIYHSLFGQERTTITGSGKARIHHIEFESRGIIGVNHIKYGNDLTVHLIVEVNREIQNPTFIINFFTAELQVITQCCSLFNEVIIPNLEQKFKVSVKFDTINFNPGLYFLDVAITDEKNMEILIKQHAIKKLHVDGHYIGYAPILPMGQWSTEKTY